VTANCVIADCTWRSSDWTTPMSVSPPMPASTVAT
jgi:hypothetical protein